MSSLPRVTLLQTGETFPELSAARGGFDRWFADGFGGAVGGWEVVDAHRGAPLPSAEGVWGVVVTGSPMSVYERHAWSEEAAGWLARVIARGAPVLGVCYGHQLIAHALGGRVERAARGREIGGVEVERLADDPLFEGLPARFGVWQSHSDEVVAPPPGARVIARNAHSAVQAMAIGEACRTVQWHPEFDAGVMRHYIGARAHLIDAERGTGAAAALLASQPAALPSGAAVMGNFARLLRRGGA